MGTSQHLPIILVLVCNWLDRDRPHILSLKFWTLNLRDDVCLSLATRQANTRTTEKGLSWHFYGEQTIATVNISVITPFTILFIYAYEYSIRGILFVGKQTSWRRDT